MTFDEFMDAVAELGRKWRDDGALRDEDDLCPICSLAFDRGWRTDRFPPNDAVDKAAEYLGMDDKDVEAIANVSDDTYREDHPYPDYPDIRERLRGLVDERT